MGVSNYTPTGISHATSVDFSKRSVNQPVHIVQYDRSLPILAVSLYNNGQLYRLSETMEVSIRLGKPDRTFVYNKALGCDSTRTIVYFEITQQMSLFDGEYYPVIEIMDGDKIANSSTIYLVVDRNPVQHDYIESTIEYKELIDYRDEAVKAGNEAKESAKIASDSATNARQSETNAKESENESVKYGNLSKSYAVGTDNAIRENDAEDNAKTYCETAKISAGNAKQSETNAKTYLDKIIEKVDVVVDAEMSDTSENPVQNKVIKKYVDDHSADVADMTGATATQNGTHGLVPAPQIGDEKKALLGNGTWGSVDAILTYKTKEEYDAAVANNEIPDGAKVIKEYDEEDHPSVIDVDATMSDTSTNPVQNKVIKAYVDNHAPEITVDADMSDTSTNPVQNKVIKAYIDNHAPEITVDATMSDTSTSPVQNKVIKAYVDAKKVPTFECNDSIFENSAFIVPITDGDIELITSTTDWDENNGGHRIHFMNKQSAETSFSTNIKVPAHSVVLIDLMSLNKETIVVMSNTLFYNNTDKEVTQFIQCYIKHAMAKAACTINLYPIIIKNI